VFAGTENILTLPEPDLKVDLNDEEIRNLKTDLIGKFKNPYRNDAEDFHPDFIKEMMEEDDDDGGGHDHHHGHSHGGSHEHHGEEPEHHGNGHGQHHEEHKHHEHHHNAKHGEHNDDEEGGLDHEEHSGHEHDNHEHEGHEHGGHDHGGHDHGGHDHGGMGFMSMVEMTRDMPRATDGLAMERNNVWFGPFFPGLPGGLAFQFTIDGDTVVEVQAEKELFENTSFFARKLTPEKFLEEIAKLNTLLPKTYRIMAEQLLKKSAGQSTVLNPQQIIYLEKERISNHLNWLSSFGILVGNQWMEKEAARQMRNFQNDKSATNLNKFIQKIQRFKLLKNKLQGAGEIPENLLHHTSGPTARAAGKTDDARSADETYKKAGFETITLNENNAWGRLQLRLLEIEQSLDILQKLENEMDKSQQAGNYFFGESTSLKMEGSAGIIEAELQTENGRFKKVTITEASAIHIVLADQLVKEMELSDALVTIASLDINPLAVVGKCITYKND
jgi:Ni,Fe-hydrogenase III large subunit